MSRRKNPPVNVDELLWGANHLEWKLLEEKLKTFDQEEAAGEREKGLREHNAQAMRETGATRQDVRDYAEQLRAKGEKANNVMLDTCDVFKISRTTYYRYLKEK